MVSKKSENRPGYLPVVIATVFLHHKSKSLKIGNYNYFTVSALSDNNCCPCCPA